MVHLFQNFRSVSACAPQAIAASPINGAYVSLREVLRAFVLVAFNQATADKVTISLKQATDVGGDGAKALAIAVPIWANEATAAGDSLVRQVDGVSYLSSAATGSKLVGFDIRPELLDVNGGFEALEVVVTCAAATTVVAATYVLHVAHAQETDGVSTPISVLLP